MIEKLSVDPGSISESVMLLESNRSIKSFIFLAFKIVQHDKGDDHEQNNRENKNENPGLIFGLLLFLLVLDMLCLIHFSGMDNVWVLEAVHIGGSIFLLRLWEVMD